MTTEACRRPAAYVASMSERGKAAVDRTDEELVVVFRTPEEPVAAVAKSILDAAGVACTVKGGFINDLTGISRLGTMFRPGIRPVEILVLESDASEAKVVLSELLLDQGGRHGADKA
jgi:hypothetical protein